MPVFHWARGAGSPPWQPVSRLAATGAALLLASACTGVIGDTGGPGETGMGPSGSRNSGPGGPTGGDPAGTTPGSKALTDPFAKCTAGGTTPGPAPLSRVTTIEYRNTISDLFPKLSLPVDTYALPAEIATEGFTNNAETQTPSAALIEALATNAHTVAETVTVDPAKILPCKPNSPTEETDCGHQFITAFGPRAFRGSFDGADQSRYDAFFDTAYGSFGLRPALRMVIEAMLQSPKFLYRIEIGTAQASGAVALTSPELASRLSYFLTDTMPDQTLLDAAKSDTLRDVGTLESEARRLLGDQKTRAAVAAFNGQWLRFDKMDALTKAPDLFPTFTAATANSMRQATARYVDHLFWDEGQTLSALLTDTHAYVDGELAPLYGVSAPAASSGLSLVDVGGAERAGILTQAGLLAGFAHERTDAPVLRGVFVLDRLLCATPKPPPVGVNTSLPALMASAHLTTRQQLEGSHVAPQCAYCHDTIDGIGFAFEKYDAVGQWRTTEFDVPVDDTGELRGTDVDGPVHGAIELGDKLAHSAQVGRCASTQLLRYALGVTRTEIDPCMVKSVVNRFDASGRDLRELLVAVVTSDAFRYRTIE
ncbi:MAG TPA: DUF1592 domain-containing protein [Polyangiaceae bacterium]